MYHLERLAKNRPLSKYLCLVGLVLLSHGLLSQSAVEFFEKGKANANLGEYTQALKDFTKAIELDPDFSKAYNFRGVVKEAIGDFTGAIEDYTKAIELKAEYSLAYYNRGLVNLTMGKKDCGCSDLDKAAKLGNVHAADSKKERCN